MLTRLPHRVGLQTKATTTLSGGVYSYDWTTASTIWANVQPIKDIETYANDKDQAITTHKVVIRKRDIDNSYRFLFGGRKFHIEAVHDPTERGRMLTCYCREEKSN